MFYFLKLGHFFEGQSIFSVFYALLKKQRIKFLLKKCPSKWKKIKKNTVKIINEFNVSNLTMIQQIIHDHIIIVIQTNTKLL